MKQSDLRGKLTPSSNDMIDKEINMLRSEWDRYKVIGVDKANGIDWSLQEEIEGKIIEEMVHKQNEITEYHLRNTVVPPIKDEITKGKVRWRGLSIGTYNSGLNSTTYLLQRGKQIACLYSMEGIVLGINEPIIKII
jgi:hypothetical protein